MVFANVIVIAMMVLSMGLVSIILYLKVKWALGSDSFFQDMGETDCGRAKELFYWEEDGGTFCWQ